MLQDTYLWSFILKVTWITCECRESVWPEIRASEKWKVDAFILPMSLLLNPLERNTTHTSPVYPDVPREVTI